jgi:two-component system LytT family response regulator
MPEYSDMIRILIVDDEEAAGNILRVLIDRHLPVPYEIKVSTDPLEALDFIASFHPTLVMLDIEMPGLNGFDFLNKAGNWDFDVIFTTAFDQYAIKAIRFSALDYLLKPIDIIDLQNALNRHIVRRQFGKKEPNPLVGHLMENLSKPTVQEFRLALASSDGTHFVLPADIVRCEGDDNYSVDEWMTYHAARNDSSHRYGQEIAEDVLRVLADFGRAAQRLLAQLKARND